MDKLCVLEVTANVLGTFVRVYRDESIYTKFCIIPRLSGGSLGALGTPEMFDDDRKNTTILWGIHGAGRDINFLTDADTLGVLQAQFCINAIYTKLLYNSELYKSPGLGHERGPDHQTIIFHQVWTSCTRNCERFWIAPMGDGYRRP